MTKQITFPYKSLLILFFFSVAMAFVESAIVVYLRALYYPEGFSFPLKEMPWSILRVEIAREAATLIMLAAVGWFAATTAITRFAGFMIAFGIWDIFYYVFLKILLNWPAHWFEWDILFLIPVVWTGPVIAPILVSLALISAGIIIWWFAAKHIAFKIMKWEWMGEILAGLIILISFFTNMNVIRQQGVPKTFIWPIFLVGLFLGLTLFYLMVRRNLKQSKKKQ